MNECASEDLANLIKRIESKEAEKAAIKFVRKSAKLEKLEKSRLFKLKKEEIKAGKIRHLQNKIDKLK